jgi:uncharacterized membrane protein
MKLKIVQPIWQVIGLGVLAGMRSASAPALTSHILSHHQSRRFKRSALGFMQSDKVANVLKVMALGELVADKLPGTPDRVKPAVITVRCLSGALSGASIYKAIGERPVTGALLGATAALASTFGFYFLRKNTVRKTKIMDPIIGAIEDALVVGAGMGFTYAVEA